MKEEISRNHIAPLLQK